MTDPRLLALYQDELAYLRYSGEEFARRHGSVARRLSLGSGASSECPDPHVERFLEGAAFLTARVRATLEDDLEEFSAPLLDLLYPDLAAPVPSCAMIQFRTKRTGTKPTTASAVRARASLRAAAPPGDFECEFRTTTETAIPPLDVESLVVNAAPSRDQWRFEVGATPAALTTLRFRAFPGVTFDKAEQTVSGVRGWIAGPPKVASGLFELLGCQILGCEARAWSSKGPEPTAQESWTNLGAKAVRPAGFGERDALIGGARRSLSGYRIVQEYFVFPEKFNFVDLDGWERIPKPAGADVIEVRVLCGRRPSFAPESVKEARKHFRIGCVPIVNLFERQCEPITVTAEQAEYEARPDRGSGAADDFEIRRVLDVESFDPSTNERRPVRPFFGFRQERRTDAPADYFWFPRRREGLEGAWHKNGSDAARKRETDTGQFAAQPTERADAPTKVWLTIVDGERRKGSPAAPQRPLEASVRAECTNFLRAKAIPADDAFDGPPAFHGDDVPSFLEARCVVDPSEPSRAPVRLQTLWQVLSHLNLNFVSLIEDPPGPSGDDETSRTERSAAALRELLALYAPSPDCKRLSHVHAIKSVRTARRLRLVRFAEERAGGVRALTPMPVPGLDIDVVLDARHFNDASPFSFSRVLAEFFRQYVALNCYVRTRVHLDRIAADGEAYFDSGTVGGLGDAL